MAGYRWEIVAPPHFNVVTCLRCRNATDFLAGDGGTCSERIAAWADAPEFAVESAGAVRAPPSEVIMYRAPAAAGMALFVVASCLATLAVATSQRTFVSVTGNDANPCSVTLPCRSFGTAMAQTTAGGEVIVVDSGGYGPVTINQPVSITAPAGVYAGVSVGSGTGIVVNPGAGIVNLTGLSVIGLGGAYGIDYQSGDTLRLNNIVVSGLSAAGLSGHLSTSGNIVIRNSAFLNNGFFGIDLQTSSGSLAVSIERTLVEGNAYGLNLTDNVVGVVADTTIRNNSAGGAFIQALSAGTTNKVTLQRCTISRNYFGLGLGGTLVGTSTIIEVADSEISDNANAAVFTEFFGTAYFTNTKITRNGVGIDTATFGGNAISFGDNIVIANGAGQTFSSTALKK